MADDNTKVGRPLRGKAPGRPLAIRVTDEERALWERAAGDEPLSDWLRAVANRAAKRATS